MKTIKKTSCMNLKHYNAAQRQEIQRVYDEIKWHLGIEKNRDPYYHPEDKKLIENRLAEVLINGFAEHLRSMVTKTDTYTGSIG